jgi:uncharacterized membrane protein
MRNKRFYIVFAIVVFFAVAMMVISKQQLTFDPLPREAVAPNVTPFASYERAKVISIEQEDEDEIGEIKTITQLAKIKFVTGDVNGTEQELQYAVGDKKQRLSPGQTVVVAKVDNPQSTGGNEYVIIDVYRMPYLLAFAALFIILAIVFARWRGVAALVGLAFSFIVLLFFLAPRILTGQNPALIAVLAASITAIVSIYTAHGFRRRTTLAVISTLLVLGLAYGLAMAAIQLLHLFGNGSEEIFLLQATALGTLNLQGLLLAGIIIGTLGILDDITTAQSAVVEELYLAKPDLSTRELYSRGMSVGQEHIASLINTLFLAYAGAFFPLFLVIVLNFQQPIWVVLNSEFIAEEITRALVGSSALILAVPLTTALSAWYFARTKKQTQV